MIQILMMRWSSLNRFSFQSMSWMHYGLVLVSLIIRRSNIFHDIDNLLSVIQQKCDSLRQQLIEACTSTNVELPFSPSYSVPSFLRSWYDAPFLLGQHPPRYVSNEHLDFCYLPSLSCSGYSTIRSLSCINKLDDILIFYLRRMFFPSFCTFSFFFWFFFYKPKLANEIGLYF